MLNSGSHLKKKTAVCFPQFAVLLQNENSSVRGDSYLQIAVKLVVHLRNQIQGYKHLTKVYTTIKASRA